MPEGISSNPLEKSFFNSEPGEWEQDSQEEKHGTKNVVDLANARARKEAGSTPLTDDPVERAFFDSKNEDEWRDKTGQPQEETREAA